MRREKRYFIDIKDKVILSKKRCCIPHYLPHKLPFGKKITNEPCHYHNSKWRMSHHIPFCWLWCKNYKFMIDEYNTCKKNCKKLSSRLLKSS